MGKLEDRPTVSGEIASPGATAVAGNAIQVTRRIEGQAGSRQASVVAVEGVWGPVAMSLKRMEANYSLLWTQCSRAGSLSVMVCPATKQPQMPPHLALGVAARLPEY